MKKFMLVCCAIATVFLAGCAKKEATSSSSFKIGYCINNFNDTFQTYIVDACEKYLAANHPEVEFITADAREDVIQQQDQINSLITQGVNALIVVPVDTSAMAPITKAAEEAGIPICYVNRNPYGESNPPANVYYVGSQEVTAGEMQMNYIGEKLGGRGGVGILQGILSNEGAVKRTEGNENVINSKYPEITVLAKETGNWQRDQGLNIVQNWLTAYGTQLNAVLANNDEMALGAYRALAEAGRTDVLVIGVDGIPDAITSIENGELAGSVLQDAVGQGEGAAKTIMTALSGSTPAPITWVDFKLITPENVAEFK
ncbi:MAG: sugar ABC transporter substrate-binding protein [Spirochaetaceae bacterium]|nr:sugar ABC transporter substrate-binding protein [Spirochaetaceae bacterium]